MSLFRLESHGRLGSTNEVVKAALERRDPEVPEGLAVTAREQLGGYGRQGRRWASPEGGMYLSVLLRPDALPSQLPTLSLAIAVGVRRALSSLLPVAEGRHVQVKWPNDIVCAEAGPWRGGPFRKLVGISLEQHGTGLCAGIGVNVLAPMAGEGVLGARPAEEGKNRPAYLEELGFGGACDRAAAIAEVREAVMAELERAYLEWRSQGLAALKDEYEEHSALVGRIVTVEDRRGGILAQGQVEGLDDMGRLLVRPQGAVAPIAVASGEAHLRPLAG